jgi:prophage DNA circulation protein
MGVIDRPLFSALQTASWRGVPFALRGGTLKLGRRVALHEYPYRDDVWVEDLGRAGHRISVSGFLLQDAAYGGGDVLAQRAALIAACETEDQGDGELVHPSLGRVNVSLLEFECEESTAHGRSFELRFTFIDAGTPRFPALSITTPVQTRLSAAAAFAAAAQDFVNDLSSLLTTPPLIGELRRTAQAFVTDAQSVTQRATTLVAMVATLKGEYGRFVGQFTAGIRNTSTTIAQLAGAGARARESVAQSGKTLTAAAAHADAAGMASAARTLVTAVQTANADPHQAVQSLAALHMGAPAQERANAALTAANAGVTALLRRSAVIALADSTTGYALTSYDDARQLRATVRDALDHEIVIAADAGDDATFTALGALETAVVHDLATRGETLATMREIAMGAPLPVIVIAH